MISGMLKNTLVGSLAAATLVACGSAGSPSLPAMSVAAQRAALNRAHRGSWMSPLAKSAGQLVYVSSQATNEVYAYTYPGGKLVGTLAGFARLLGLCSDTKGDVFVVDAGASEIVKYAHGGTAAIASLSDPSQFPYDCAVDPKTGDLAVGNYVTLASNGNEEPGDVAIYKRAQGMPNFYTMPVLSHPEGGPQATYCGYDDKGNLFVDGIEQVVTPSGGTTEAPFLDELSAGQTKFVRIKVDKPFGGSGIQWDGKYLAVGDPIYLGREESAVDRISISGTTGKVVQTWVVLGVGYLSQFAVTGNEFIAADNQNGTVGFYQYDVIHPPTKLISGIGQAFGVALSAAKE